MSSFPVCLPHCHTSPTLPLLTPDVRGFLPTSPSLRHQLGAPQMNSGLTLSAWRRQRQILQVKGSVPRDCPRSTLEANCKSRVSVTFASDRWATDRRFPRLPPHSSGAHRSQGNAYTIGLLEEVIKDTMNSPAKGHTGRGLGGSRGVGARRPSGTWTCPPTWEPSEPWLSGFRGDFLTIRC